MSSEAERVQFSRPLKARSIMNKKEIAKEFTPGRRSFSEGRRQMLDPNKSSINFEQVTTMLSEIQQTRKEVLSNMDSLRIRERYMDSTFSARHSQLQSLTSQLDSLNAKLEQSSTLFSKSQKSSLWQRYWIAVTVGAISALLTNLLVMIL